MYYNWMTGKGGGKRGGLRVLYYIVDYLFFIRHLTTEEGGGYLIEYPDLPGCISDGETIEEAICNGQDAVICWIKAAKAIGRDIPKSNELA
jgi:antitoxin HicB